MSTNDEILRHILKACGEYHAEALGTFDPRLAEKTLSFQTFVGVCCDPPGARLFLQAADGAVICPHQIVTLPPALATATARALEAGLAQLSDGARANLLEGLAEGRKLGVLVSRDTSSVHIVVDAGDTLPRVLATLQPGGQELSH